MLAVLRFQDMAPSELENGTLLVAMVMEGFMGRGQLISTKLEIYSSEQNQNCTLMNQGKSFCALTGFPG